MSAYDMRISDWSSGVCSSDLRCRGRPARAGDARILERGMAGVAQGAAPRHRALDDIHGHQLAPWRSEEHTSELQSLMRTSYAVFCLKKKTQPTLTPLHRTLRLSPTHSTYNIN